MQQHCGHVAACTKRFPLHYPADWWKLCTHGAECYLIYLSAIPSKYFLYSTQRRQYIYVTLCWQTHWPLDSPGQTIWISLSIVKNSQPMWGSGKIKTGCFGFQKPTTLSTCPLITLNWTEKLSWNPLVIAIFWAEIKINWRRTGSFEGLPLWWKLGQSPADISTFCHTSVCVQT